MISTRINFGYSQNQDVRIMKSLNKNRIVDPSQKKEIKAMGLAACQGLCITYHVHSKAFCK